MRKNYFGDPILEPGDDIGAAFGDTFCTDFDAKLTAFCIAQEGDGLWSCTIEDEDANEITAMGFATEDELRGWLSAALVSVDEDRF